MKTFRRWGFSLICLAGMTAAADASAAAITALSMNFDGSFTDAAGHVFSSAGSPVISSSVTDGGSAGSLQIDEGHNYLRTAVSPAFNVGSSDFDISASVYFTTTISQYAGILDEWGSASSYELNFITKAGQGNTVTPVFTFRDQSGQHSLTGSDVSSLFAWHDVSVIRTGSTLVMDVDNQQVGSMAINGALNAATAPLWIGESECANNSVCWNHGGTYYIDNLSFTVGTPSPVTPTGVPEPFSLALLASGFLAVASLRLGRR